MRLYGVRIWVDDIAAASDFYRDTLGLPVNWQLDELGAAGFSVGNAELIVEEAEEEDEEMVGRFVGLSLQVDDIETEYRRLTEAGVDFVAPPEKQAWGGTLAHFFDSAGNVLTLLGA